MANIDLSAISDSANTALALANLILVTPQENIGYVPQNQDGSRNTSAALLFHTEGENTVSLESDITDHYVEDNSAINDNISLKPEVITTNGFIGELNDVPPEFLQDARTQLSRLEVIGAYVPELTVAAQEAYNESFRAYQLAQTATSVLEASKWRSVNNSGEINTIGANGLEESPESLNLTQNKQQVFFQQLYGLWKARTLFTIQTPWAIFENCPILKLKAIQDKETRQITDFEVTFKVVRFAKTENTTEQQVYDPSQFQDRTFNQGSQEVNFGVQSPIDSVSLGGILS
tara:strand:- start:21982 stop:22848 length:867 start_codon:yes stop_codon:yes gene_type:complete